MTLFSDLHKLQFFVHEISCTHNRFRCTFVRVGKRARKKADVHIENKNIFIKIYKACVRNNKKVITNN